MFQSSTTEQYLYHLASLDATDVPLATSINHHLLRDKVAERQAVLLASQGRVKSALSDPIDIIAAALLRSRWDHVEKCRSNFV